MAVPALRARSPRPRPPRPCAVTPGMVADRYLLQRQLGRGASKDVWLAHDLTLDRGVALARVSGPDGVGAAAARGAADRAARRPPPHRHRPRRLRRRRHAVPGRALHDRRLAGRPARARARGRLEPQEVIAAGREIADALAHAHAHGVVHRDVKPDNVWIDAEGEAALGRLRRRGRRGRERASPPGTPRYAAPEQTLGEAVDAAQRPVRARRDALRAAVRRAAVRHQGRAAAAHARRRRRASSPACRRSSTGWSSRCSRPTPTTGRRTPRGVAGALDAPDRARAGGAGGARGPRRPRAGARAPARACSRRRGAARRGRSLIAGEPGIGKTTLLDALATEAGRRGGVAIWGRGEAEGRAYGVWRPIVRSLSALVAGEPDPALAPLLGGAAAPAARRSGCGSTTRSPTCSPPPRPSARCCVVLDDLHWADASSLRLLAHVVGAEPAARLLLAGSYTPARSAFGDVLREIEGDPRAELMELARARPGGRARAAAGRDARAEPGPRAHGRQPVLRRRARAPAGHRRRRSATTASTLVPDARARSGAPARRAARRRRVRRARGRRGRGALHDRRPRARRRRVARDGGARRSTAGPRPGS